MAIERAEVIEYLSGLTVMEISDLVKDLEEKWDVKASSGGGMMMMPGMMPGAAEEAEEQTEFDVILEDYGEKKIQAIKVHREVSGLGLAESKDAVEALARRHRIEAQPGAGGAGCLIVTVPRTPSR